MVPSNDSTRIKSGNVDLDPVTRAINFSTTDKGGSPHLSFVFINPKPLGPNSKCIICYKICVILFIEIKQGKEGINSSKYWDDIDVTSTLTNNMIEATNSMIQFNNNKRYCYIFGIWFAFERVDEYAWRSWCWFHWYIQYK